MNRHARGGDQSITEWYESSVSEVASLMVEFGPPSLPSPFPTTRYTTSITRPTRHKGNKISLDRKCETLEDNGSERDKGVALHTCILYVYIMLMCLNCIHQYNYVSYCIIYGTVFVQVNITNWVPPGIHKDGRTTIPRYD